MSCVQDLSKNYFFRCKLTLLEINLKQNRLHSEKRVGEGSCEIVLLLKKIPARVSASFKIEAFFYGLRQKQKVNKTETKYLLTWNLEYNHQLHIVNTLALYLCQDEYIT